MDLQMANSRHLLIGIDLLMANASPAPSAPNNFANNKSALHFMRKLCLIIYNILFLPGEVVFDKS